MVGSSISNNETISSGVQQGSILGPLLFLAYVNDIANHLLNVTRLFADYTSLAKIVQVLERVLEITI